MKFWSKISNLDLDRKDYSEWEIRNLRFMNSMTFILACAMIFFGLMGVAFEITESLPWLGLAFMATLLFYIIKRHTKLIIAKLYFCLIPTAIVMMFASLIVGEVGNDKYFLIVCSIIPLIIFNDKKFYLSFILFNFLAFILIGWIQTIHTPAVVLPDYQLSVYINTNAVVIFTFIFFLLNLFKKEIFDYQLQIESQKEQIQEHSNEVRQSIEYAKRIQEAILPPRSFIKNNLKNSFVLYKPKDIVAGDFYWMEKVGSKVLFACADCTGHGVPGAMVSVVCCNALHRTVNEFGITSPEKILDKTRELVIDTFKNSDREVKDGMDIGLCSYDATKNELQFAGANNGLYLFRNGEIIETKPNKQPIGNYDKQEPFDLHKITLHPDDTIFLFTDGFADQFGGDKGKKYKYKPFKELLAKLNNTKIEEQGVFIEQEFERWRGEIEQVDDVCIIGVKF